jgi:two-component system, cell cycle sensor histidine kinase and response regulator CckA
MADDSAKRPTGPNGIAHPGKIGAASTLPAAGNGCSEHSASETLALGRATAAEQETDQTWFRMLFEEAPDAIFLETLDDRIVDANKAATRLLGYQREEFLAMTIADLQPPSCRGIVGTIITSELERGGVFEGLDQHRDGTLIWIEVHNRLVSRGDQQLVLSIVRDISRRKREEQLQAARLRLIACAAEHSSQELLQKCLDEAETLTGSKIGFYHFLGEDEQTLDLQTWSRHTVERCCRIEVAELHGRHYPVADAGVWVDCIRERGPIIHNDYASLPHKRGYPEGHAVVTREVVVPVLRDGRIVALLGVGNKELPYTDDDARLVQQLADLAWETVGRKRAEEALKESETRFRTLVEESPMSIVLVRDGRYIYGNPQSARMLGYSSAEELVGQDILQRIAPEHHDQVLHRMKNAELGFTNVPQELHLIRPDGQSVWAVSTSIPVTIDGQKAIIVVGNDISGVRQAREETARLEEQVRQAQKLESIGRLAGGVAHDLNNLLSPILGYSEMLMDDLAAEDPRRETAEQVVKAALRAGDLVRQLLAFSRKQALELKTIDVNSLLVNFEKLLRRTIREDISINLRLADVLPPVNGNIGQLEQVIMNLAVNAQDAMPGGGVLTITTGLTDRLPSGLQPQPAEQPAAEHYIVLSVGDTGCGIEAELLPQIFDPFFTTKGKHEGTGLGLATVYGIVKQHRGEITVTSRSGAGAEFTIYLPTGESRSNHLANADKTALPAGGNETVLVVEDNAQLLELATMILRRKGYQVLATDTGEAALALLEFHHGPLHLLLTDVILPGLNGRQLFELVVQRYPGVKVLFMSGYIDEAVVKRESIEQAESFLQKPFSVQTLAGRVRALLDRQRGAE